MKHRQTHALARQQPDNALASANAKLEAAKKANDVKRIELANAKRIRKAIARHRKSFTLSLMSIDGGPGIPVSLVSYPTVAKIPVSFVLPTVARQPRQRTLARQQPPPDIRFTIKLDSLGAVTEIQTGPDKATPDTGD